MSKRQIYWTYISHFLFYPMFTSLFSSLLSPFISPSLSRSLNSFFLIPLSFSLSPPLYILTYLSSLYLSHPHYLSLSSLSPISASPSLSLSFSYLLHPLPLSNSLFLLSPSPSSSFLLFLSLWVAVGIFHLLRTRSVLLTSRSTPKGKRPLYTEMCERGLKNTEREREG